MVHDYGAPVAWRLALEAPEKITAIVSQNGNAYEEGVPDLRKVAPDGYTLEGHHIAKPGMAEIQLDLLLDYASNVKQYPEYQAYFRTHQPPLLAVWGKHDRFFLPAGAQAWKRDIPNAEIHLFDTGHFALETHQAEIIPVIKRFLGENIQ